MSVGYKAIQWSRHKRVYDAVAATAAVMCAALLFAIGKARWGDANNDVQLLLRALGVTAILLLHVVLAIGPLARLDRRFLPLLFNRRHLGVLTFLLALSHASLAVLFYHAGGVVNPLVSALTGGPGGGQVAFEPFGAAALLILFLLAATSHDFWLRNLGARCWKRLHMGVYAAYALLVAHVALGALRDELSPLPALLLGAGALSLTTLHVAAALRERRLDSRVGTSRPDATPAEPADQAPWVDACAVADIPEGRARPCPIPNAHGRDDRVAVFKYQREGRLLVSATTNVCAHQGGPLGEGRVIDGCATCPWHGWQYRPQDGCAPPPFTERIPTYRVRIVAGRVQVDPRPLPAGTPIEPAPADGEAS